MAGLWQRTGNVTVTNGSKTITGFGTKWKTGTLPIQKGHTFYGPDNAAYEVDTVVSDESILLVDTYRGGTLANQAYRIDITRTSTISQFAADLASLVGKYRTWFDGMMTWLTGSGDVSILNPDTGANTTIPSWKKVTSEGEGQAARAKMEADKAAASAALAGDIVATSALPLPDVWAPLSDSLRLITGYGRDVLVGSDVVARMVNFSRNSTATYIGKDGQLKTAAANEPRFEKEGLLVEGQSTNYIVRSEGLTQLAPEPDSVVVVENGVTLVKYVGTGALAKDCTVPANTVLTLSFFVKLGATDTVITFQTRDGSFTGRTAIFRVKPTGELVVTNANGLLSAWSVVKVSPTLVRIIGTTIVSDSTTYRTYRGDPVANETFGSFQLEALTFASSYIPTAGAAVTRAPDKAWIQTAGNIAASPFTVAMEVNFRGINSTSRYARLFTCGPACYAFFTDTNISGRFNSTSPVTAFSLNPIGRAVSGMVFNGATAKLFSAKKFGPASAISALSDADMSGDLILGSTTTLSSADTLFGHIRDVKIWRRTLTDDQIKAVA
ncbi:LamG domain-containing protein [Aeromonas rivipollensis]|uniref:LamG domain-containing protein n=1 Tax=Aeromonas rivipollensis TaxID=948519 RepID=A0ABX0D197_9GAMM|nr:LamG domain-containing protein [Aeromonas rivipollensis]NEX89120.1 LamG domain-containing protein [Aeromonas rivipollensis]NEY04986.1 LamG domain-containing protein [Aeromonas rivipollensis]